MKNLILYFLIFIIASCNNSNLDGIDKYYGKLFYNLEDSNKTETNYMYILKSGRHALYFSEIKEIDEIDLYRLHRFYNFTNNIFFSYSWLYAETGFTDIISFNNNELTRISYDAYYIGTNIYKLLNIDGEFSSKIKNIENEYRKKYKEQEIVDENSISESYYKGFKYIYYSIFYDDEDSDLTDEDYTNEENTINNKYKGKIFMTYMGDYDRYIYFSKSGKYYATLSVSENNGSYNVRDYIRVLDYVMDNIYYTMDGDEGVSEDMFFTFYNDGFEYASYLEYEGEKPIINIHNYVLLDSKDDLYNLLYEHTKVIEKKQRKIDKDRHVEKLNYVPNAYYSIYPNKKNR